MGILNFGKLKSYWTDIFDPDWGKVSDNFKTAGKSAWNGLLSVQAGAMNLFLSPWKDDITARAAMDEYRKAAGQFGSSLGGVGGGLSEVPVLRQVFGTVDWLQTELVKRPLSTTALMAGDVHKGNTDFSRFLDGERWRQAYNSTTYVTPGQAYAYMAISEAQAFNRDAFGVEFDELERRDILRANPSLGIIAQDPSDLDPRNIEQRKLYKNNPYLKYVSGTLDAGITMFGDPTIVLGKLGVVSKAKFISKEMNAAAIAKGKHIDFMNHPGAYTRAKQFIADAENPDVVARTMFNNKYNGDLAANLLWDAARTQPEYARLGGQTDLYDLTWLALYGDPRAWATLTREAPRIGEVIGRQYANYTIGHLGKQYGLGDKAVDAQWNALRENEAEAFVDSMLNGHGAFGQLGEKVKSGGLLADQAVPRLRVSSKWRVGVHQSVRNGPPTLLGFWARRAQHVLPTSRTHRVLDLRDPNGSHLLRANLEHSRLTDAEIGRWVSAYARATSDASRFAIQSAAENHGLRKAAARYGIDTKKIDELLPMVNRWRSGNRQVLGSSRRFMSQDVRNLAKKRIAEGKQREADELNKLADEVDKAVERGDIPAAAYHIPDERGNVARIPVETVGTTAPTMLSQLADVVPLVDWNVLENALWWGTKGGFGKRAYQVIDGARAALDALMSVWKISAILRPGYIWRALSDEEGRAWSVMGAARSFMAAVPAVKNVPYNMWSRGVLLGEIATRRAYRRKASGQTDIELDGELVDDVPTATKATLAADARFDPLGAMGEGKVYTSYERAFADGLIGVDDLIQRIEAHGEAGTLPRPLADVYHGKHTAGTYKDAEGMYRRHLVDAVMSSVSDGAIRRDVYINPAWQESIINELVDQPPKPLQAKSAPSPQDAKALQLRLAIEAVVNDQLGSASLIQRRLKVGYATAKRLLDELEARGIVGPSKGGSARDVLLGSDKLQDALAGLPPVTPTTPAASKVAPATKKPKPAGQVSRGLIVDPFSGLSPKLKWDKVPENFSMSKTRVITVDKDGRFDGDDIYDYIADNVDDLLRPGAMFSAYFRPDGVIALSVATVNKESAKLLNIKPSAGKRVKLPLFKPQGRLYRDSGTARLKISVGDGQGYTFRAAFEGQEGDLFRKQTSSRGVDDAAADYMSNLDFARFKAKSGRWVDVTSDKPEYGADWERAVNLQYANDSVAQQFLAGRTEDDIFAWLHNTAAGRAYQWKIGPWRSRYVEQVRIVGSHIDTHLPIVEGREAESWALRKAALNGQARFSDYGKLVPKEDMPRIHGADVESAVGGRVTDFLRKRVDDAFKVLSDMPNDKFVRHPFANERYRTHVQELAKVRSAHLDRKTLTQDDLDAIEREARSRSLMDVRKYLYENAASLDLAKAFRLLVPFGSAIGDSTLKWGVVLREKPWVASQVWKLWTAPEKAGLVVDEDGNQLRMEDGKEVWYKTDPKTGEETRLDGHAPKQKRIAFRLPSWMGPEYAQGMMPFTRFDKNVFHTFLDMPTFGPAVTVPANEFSLSHPEFAENKFVRTFVLPYGGSADVKRAFMPGNMRTFYDQWQGEDAPEAEGQAQAIYATEMVNYAQGKRAKPPTYDEAREKAAAMRGLRFWYRIGGVSAQFVSPYQPYIDYYHMLQSQAGEEARKAERGEPDAKPFDADLRFYDEVGDEFFALTARVTSNVMGLPATLGAFRQHRKLEQLMERFPELASLIAGAEGAGEFNKTVYESQKQTRVRFGSQKFMREPLSPEDSWKDLQRRKGWIEYSKFMDAVHGDMRRIGVDSLEQKSAARLKAARQRWIDARRFVDSPYGGTVINPWFQEFASFDKSSMTARLHAMRQVVNDTHLQGRDDIAGLIDYLEMRGQFRRYMQFNKFKTLDAKKATTLRRQWQSAIFRLKDRNLSFAQLYDRWLSNDETLEAE